jgi:hypothetical protein
VTEQDDKLLRYFIQHTDEKFSEVKADLKDLRSEIQSLNQFKWKVAGAAAALGAVATLVYKAFEALSKGN